MTPATNDWKDAAYQRPPIKPIATYTAPSCPHCDLTLPRIYDCTTLIPTSFCPNCGYCCEARADTSDPDYCKWCGYRCGDVTELRFENAALTARLILADRLADAVDTLKASHCEYTCPHYDTCFIDDGRCTYDDAVSYALKNLQGRGAGMMDKGGQEHPYPCFYSNQLLRAEERIEKQDATIATLTIRIKAADDIISDYEEVIQWYLNRLTNFRERYSRLGKLIYRGMKKRMDYHAAYPEAAK